jgi:hypothetical protein
VNDARFHGSAPILGSPSAAKANRTGFEVHDSYSIDLRGCCLRTSNQTSGDVFEQHALQSATWVIAYEDRHVEPVLGIFPLFAALL